MDNLQYFKRRYGYDTQGINQEALNDFQQGQQERDWEERKKKVLEEQRKREEERKRQLELQTKIDSLKDITERENPTIEEPKEITKVDRLPSKYKDFGYSLSSDLRETVALQKSLGKSDTEIEKSLIPETDASKIRERLANIEGKIKAGDESFLYQIKEGWLEKEVMNMLSEEAVKEMNGLPNIRAEIDEFLERNPDIQISEDSNLLDTGIRGIGELTRQGFDATKFAIKDKESWLVAGVVLAGSLAVTAATGGAALPATSGLMASSLAALAPMAAAGIGMSYGSMKKMAQLEAGLAYKEYVDEGMHPEVANTIASTVGAVNGIFEIIEVGTILTGIPGTAVARNKAFDLAKNEFQKKALRALTAYGVNLGSNAIEEMVQENNTSLGMELGRYLQEAPNPNTLEGLKVLGKTMTSKEHIDRVGESGLSALQTMWLLPIASAAGRNTMSQGMKQLEARAKDKATKGWYDAQDKQTVEYQNQQKQVILGDGGAVDILAGKARNEKDSQSVAYLTSMSPMIDQLLEEGQLTNEEREQLSRKKSVIDEVVAEIEFEAKEMNSEIEFKPTSKSEILEQVLSGEVEYSTIQNPYYVEIYKEAQDKGIVEIVKNMRKEGNATSEITEAIKTLMPKDQRGAVELNRVLMAVDFIDGEVTRQRNLNLIDNFNAIQGSLNKTVEADLSEVNVKGDTKVDQVVEKPAEDTLEPQVEQKTETKYDMPTEELQKKVSDVVKLKPSDINIDSNKYQFRFDGTTDKLAGAEWNEDLTSPIIVHRNEFGDLYVIDGHNRLTQAQQQGIEFIEAKVYENITVEQARAIGALRNIAEGTATEIDVAKFMRDTGSTLADLEQLGVPPKSKIARDGAALANLDDDIFRRAAVRHIPRDRAVMIGREFPTDKVAQRSALKMIEDYERKGIRLTNDLIGEIIAQEKGMVQEGFEEISLFGNTTRSLAVERAELVSYVKGQLKNRKNILKNVSKDKNAKLLESLGNEIDTDTNVREMELAEQALYLLDKTLNYQGTTTNSIFNELAKEYANTTNKQAVKNKALNAYIEAMEKGVILSDAFGKKQARETIIESLNESIPGQESLLGDMAQIKNEPNVIITQQEGVNQDLVDSLMPVLQAMEKNPVFNGLEVEFTGKEAIEVTLSKEELSKHGYENIKEGVHKVYGYFEGLRETRNTDKSDNLKGKIVLSNEADKGTLLHELIHFIQDRVHQINPELAETIKAWESDIRSQAEDKGLSVWNGKELLANALTMGEFGYASDNYIEANLVSVDAGIIRDFTAIVGQDFIEAARGDKKASSFKVLEAKNFAEKALKDSELTNSISQAKKRRINKIKMQLRDKQMLTYYSPDTTTYAIIKPQDTDYEVSFFNEKGLLGKGEYSLTNLTNTLNQMGLYYNPSEVSYQLKQFDRTQIDEFYRQVTEVEMFRSLQNARVGNFTARDYDTTLKGKLNSRESSDILNALLRASEMGYDKPNSEISIQEYVNRFYAPGLQVDEYRLRERDGKIEYYKRDFTNYNPHRQDTIPEVVYKTFDTAEEAIADNRLDMSLEDYMATEFKDRFSYMLDHDLVSEYEDFRDNYETYREDYNVMFDGNVKTNVSYQVKNPLINSKRIDPTKGETLKVAFKGFREGETRRISTGDQEWDSLFFIADNYNDASLYGENVEIYDVSPKARILYEGTKDFSDIAKSSIRNETMLEWSSRIAIKAKEQGYDAVWFKRQGEIGTAIINREILNIPDNLKNYQLKAATDTPEFKQWFKDSKVVDEEGKPLIVYHGSANIFEEFDLNMVGDNFLQDTIGFFFTDKKDIARSYADNTSYGMPRDKPGEVYEIYLSMQNPYIVNIDYDPIDTWDSKYKSIISAAKRQGKDGIIIKAQKGDSLYIAFNPTQIKSVYNNGQFSLYDHNINYQLKNEQDSISQYTLSNINNFVEASESTELIYNDLVDELGNKVLEVEGEVKDRLIPFIKYDAVMGGYDAIKINNETSLITLDEIRDIMTQGQPLFQLKPAGDLLAVHNMSVDQLRNTIKLGGTPMPSIAVIKTDYDHARYGDVSVLFHKDTIDPRAHKGNRVYSGDAYTPSFPSIYKKIDENVSERIRMRVKNALDGVDYKSEFRTLLDDDNMSDKVNRHGGFVQSYFDDPLLKLAYVKEQGIEFTPEYRNKKYGGWEVELIEQLKDYLINDLGDNYVSLSRYEEIELGARNIINDFYKQYTKDKNFYETEIGYGNFDRMFNEVFKYAKDNNRTELDYYATKDKLDKIVDQEKFNTWLAEISEGVIEREGIRNNKDLFTPSGNRRSWESLHYNVTLDNLLKAMMSEDETAAGMFGGIGRFGAAASRVFSSIDDIKAEASRLTTMDEEVYQAMRDEYNDRLVDIAVRISDKRSHNSFIATDRAFDAMIDAIQSSRTEKGILKVLNEYNLNVNEDIAREIMSLAQEVAQMPTEYFEAKPRRIIGLDEWAGVVLPLDVDQELVRGLNQNGIHFIEYYDRNIEGDRQRAVNEILGKNDVSFQIKQTPTDTEAFKKWFKDSKVVDENGQPLVVYHGSANEFTTFDMSRTGENYFQSRNGIFFTQKERTAKNYAALHAGLESEGSVYQVYLNITNPLERNANSEYFAPADVYDTHYLELLRQAEEDGNDGIIIYGTNGDNLYVAFNPTQIKSVYNTGSWNVDDANIYYQLKNEPRMEERSWGQTVKESGIVDQWIVDLLNDNKFMYEVQGNEYSILEASKLIQEKGIPYVEQMIDSKEEISAIEMAAGMIIAEWYANRADEGGYLDAVNRVATRATTMGQGIQILATLAKRSPTGLVTAARNEFDRVTTPAQKKQIDKTHKELTDKVKDISKKAIETNEQEILKKVQEVKDLSQKDLDKIEISKSEQLTMDFVEGKEVATKPKSNVDTKLIMQAIKEHYQGNGKTSLKNALVGIGLNETEADIISKYVKEFMKNATDKDIQAAIDGLGKKTSIDMNMKDLIAEGRWGDALKSLVGYKKGIPVFTEEMAQMVYQRGLEIQKMEDGRAKDIEMAKLVRDVVEYMPVTRLSKISTFQTMMMLLNAKTMLRNLIGNRMFRELDTFTINTLGAGLDKLIASKTGQRTTLARLLEARELQKDGKKKGLAEGVEDALLGIDTSRTDTKFELGNKRSFRRDSVLGKMETALNIGLRATDRSAYTASFLDSLQEQMELAGVTEATEEMTERAHMLALYRTFNDTTVLSTMFSSIKKALNFGKEWGLGDLVMKFPRTPANIMARSIDYSPAGLVITMLKLYNDHSGDTYTRQRMAVEGFSRALMGTGLLGIGAFLATAGVLTGSRPEEDEELYDFQRQAGLRDYSVNLSAIYRYMTLQEDAGELRKGDHLASYDWAQPISMSLAIGADTVLGNGEALDLLSTIVRSTEAGVSTITDQPLFTGVANMFRYGDVTQGLIQIAKSMPASFTPSVLSQIAQAIDGRATDPYSFYGVGRQAYNLIANRVPGLRETLPGRIGVLGEEQLYFPEDELLPISLIKSMVSPAILTQYMPSKEAEFITDLYNAVGDKGVIPRKPQKQYTFSGETITPTPEEFEQWSKWLGERTRQDITYAMRNYMSNWSPEEQADEMKFLIDRARRELREKIQRERGLY